MPLCLLGVGGYFLSRLGFSPFLAAARTVWGLLFRRRGQKKAALQHTGAAKQGKSQDTGAAKRENAPSPLGAMLTALGGTVGVGNITGVALALSVGGAGAIFWMWISAFFAMILKYAEITLAMDSRVCDGRGGYTGGTAQGMRRAGWRRAPTLFSLFCLLYVLTVGGAVQANAITTCLDDAFSLPPLVGGLLLLALVLPAVLGGGRRITALACRIVPLMCLGYIGATGAVILTHAQNLGAALSLILADAFTPAAGTGGLLGFFFSRAARVGVARGLMSNEGGCGTAPMAHVTSRERVAARQGLLGILEVFADTCVICPLTALAVLCAFPTLPSGLSGIALVRAALESVFGGAAGGLLSLFLFLFAYATILCEALYGEVSARDLFPHRNTRVPFFALFGGAILFGAVGPVGAVWGLCDLVLATLTLLNLAYLIKKADRVVTLSAELKRI